MDEISDDQIEVGRTEIFVVDLLGKAALLL